MKTQDSTVDLNRQLEAYDAVAKLPEHNPRGRWGKWPIYASATAAALAGASAATADIIYSGPINLTGNPTNHSGRSLQVLQVGFQVALNVRRHLVTSAFLPMTENLLSEIARVDGSVFGTGSLVKNFVKGAPITGGTATGLGLGRQYLASANQVFTHGGTFGHPGQFLSSNGFRGNFLGGGFLGFEMFQHTGGGATVPGSGEPGWIQVAFDSTTFPGTFDVTGWAYNTDGPIDAGQISAVPEPALFPVMLLASGALGVLAWKRRRKTQAPAA